MLCALKESLLLQASSSIPLWNEEQSGPTGTSGREISEDASFDFCSFVLKQKVPAQKSSLPKHKE